MIAATYVNLWDEDEAMMQNRQRALDAERISAEPLSLGTLDAVKGPRALLRLCMAANQSALSVSMAMLSCSTPGARTCWGRSMKIPLKMVA